MADELNNPGGGTNPEVKTFTQDQLDAIISREKAKAVKGMFSADDMAAKDTSITTLTTERDTARSDLAKAQAELDAMKQEKFLLGKGVPAEDVDYYAFKIAKLVTDKKTFEQAAEEFLKGHPATGVRMSTGGDLSGGGSKTKTTNDTMNALIRGAFK